ncbi:MAG: PglZ domain-containing protein [Bacteroidales bacterium]|nr:PglZ domain-containing protein [Bacteroidales bacterium]
MNKAKILWVDDEIDFLKVHILFLTGKGYDVETANNGIDAIEFVKSTNFDIIFLDENMPGLSGLDTLKEIKKIRPEIPCVMITKNEGEDIMDEAVGSNVSDYLIKPVNPNQILLSIKKNLENKRLVSQKNIDDYRSEFQKLNTELGFINNFEDWTKIYKQLVDWEIKLGGLSSDKTMTEILAIQKDDANKEFCKYFEKNYEKWLNGNRENRPIMQHDVFKERILPLIQKGEKVFWIVIDNLRYDHWKMIQPQILQYYKIEQEELMYSIIPTATQYARNAMFAGLMPLTIAKNYPDLWTYEDELHSKNNNEEQLIQTMLNRFRCNEKFFYTKIFNNKEGQKIIDNLKSINQNKLNVAVYNFVDMMSHAHTDLPMMRELADDEASYRDITKTWFEHSSLYELIKALSETDYKIIFTTDHGNIKVNNAIKVTGEKNINSNLRYKQGRDLQYNEKEVFAPNAINLMLPTPNVSTKYIFARKRDFMAYPNNYNHYVKYYKNTFQHGGISIEENLIPLITLTPKNTK